MSERAREYQDPHGGPGGERKPRVAVVGLGRMGQAIAAAYLAAGYRTTVWNRTPARADALVARGARRAATVAGAVRAAELVIVPLLDHTAVRQALDPVGDALAGRVVVNLANGSPEEGRELAGRLTAYGARFLDGAMMALPETVATPEAFFLYSGSEAAFTTHRPALEVMAAAHYFGPDPGSAEVHDLALLGTGYAALAGFLHAAAVLDAAGTRPDAFAPLAARWLRGMADFLPELAREAAAGEYGDGVSTVDLNRVAVDRLVRISTLHGVDPAVHRPLRAMLDRRAADGGGSDSFSSVFELLRARRPAEG